MSLPDIIEGKVLAPGEGRTVEIGSSSRCTFKIVGKETHGHLGLFEFEIGPGGVGPKPHIHHGMEEIFYIIEGEPELLVGSNRTTGRPGTLALVPRGAVHAFSNPGPEKAVILIMFSPADGREGYFEGLARLTAGGRKPERAELLKLMKEFDQEPADSSEWDF